MKMLRVWNARPVCRSTTRLVGFLSFVLVIASPGFSQPAQTTMDVRPDLTPRIITVMPNQAVAGSELRITISGENFARGAYVSFSAPVIRVKSTQWISSNQLDVDLVVNSAAQPGAVKLYVSNPASSAAEAAFSVVPVTTPSTSPTPATASTTTAGESQPSASKLPEVKSVEPAQVSAGSEIDLKVKGKNFLQGAKVAFSNPGILVTETQTVKSSELKAHLKVAADAQAGPTSLFVINPDDSETEAAFEVVNTAATTSTSPSAAPAEPSKTSSQPNATGGEQQFEVYDLGEVANIMQVLNMPKGTLMAGSGKLSYNENGKEVFAVKRGEIKEVGPTLIAGFNTGIFHIILDSGKTYHFAPTSLRPADSASIINALRSALRLGQ
jgi:hypothetical protein